MLKVTLILLISSQQILNAVFGRKSKDGSTKPYEPLPFTLIKTQGGIKFPTHLLLRRTLLLKKKKLFYRSHFLKQLVFCPADSEKDLELIETANLMIKEEGYNFNKIDKDCLFILKSFGQTFSSPYPRCSRQPKPVIWKFFDDRSKGYKNEGGDSQQICGPRPKEAIAKKYEFGYQLCFKLGLIEQFGNIISKLFKKSKEEFPFDNVEDYSMYSFCYDTRTKKTIYTKHRLVSPRLLSDSEMEKEREQRYPISTDSFNLPELDFEQIKISYEKIDDLQSRQSKIQTEFKIHNLVPAEDFSFALLRRPTFHWANLELMHEKLIKYWDYVNKFIRENAIEYYREFTMYTGAFLISPPDSNEIITKEGIQIPQIWVKIIDNSYVKSVRDHRHHFLKKYIKSVEREGVAIIANNYLNENVAKLLRSSYCEENLCEHFAKEEFEEVHMFIWCCSVTDHLQNLFGINLKFYKIYVIEGLIKIKYPNIRELGTVIQ